MHADRKAHSAGAAATGPDTPRSPGRSPPAGVFLDRLPQALGAPAGPPTGAPDPRPSARGRRRGRYRTTSAGPSPGGGLSSYQQHDGAGAYAPPTGGQAVRSSARVWRGSRFDGRPPTVDRPRRRSARATSCGRGPSRARGLASGPGGLSRLPGQVFLFLTHLRGSRSSLTRRWARQIEPSSAHSGGDEQRPWHRTRGRGYGRRSPHRTCAGGAHFRSGWRALPCSPRQIAERQSLTKRDVDAAL